MEREEIDIKTIILILCEHRGKGSTVTHCGTAGERRTAGRYLAESVRLGKVWESGLGRSGQKEGSRLF